MAEPRPSRLAHRRNPVEFGNRSRLAHLHALYTPQADQKAACCTGILPRSCRTRFQNLRRAGPDRAHRTVIYSQSLTLCLTTIRSIY